MKNYHKIVAHYEACLKKYGDTPLGVDWPNAREAQIRYQIMLEVMTFAKSNKEQYKLLDFGCGCSHLLDYIHEMRYTNIDYSGLDLSQEFIAFSRKKYPDITYYLGDILDKDFHLPSFDFIVMNGVFTEKLTLDFEEMWEYFTAVLKKMALCCTQGLAFNLMSTHVDWERSDLFHVPLDRLAAFLTREFSRKFVIRNDYGLYEYTVYLYK